MLETQTPSCWWFCLISAAVSKFYIHTYISFIQTRYGLKLKACGFVYKAGWLVWSVAGNHVWSLLRTIQTIFTRNITETTKRSKKSSYSVIFNIWTWRFWEQTIQKVARAWRASLVREIDTFESCHGEEQTEKWDFLTRSNTWKSRGWRRSVHGNNNLQRFSSYLDTLFLQNPGTKDVLTV